MVFLRKVALHGKNYYYLYHTVSGKKFRKFKRFLGTKEPSREEFEILSKKFLDDIENRPEIFDGEKKITVMAALQDIQHEKGFISEEDLIQIEKNLDLRMVDIYGVVTFYSQFKLVKPGKYRIAICRGTACHVKQSDKLLDYLQQLLGIKANQTTLDGKFSLETVNCIGACAKSPAMMINKNVYGELTKDKIKQIIKSLE